MTLFHIGPISRSRSISTLKLDIRTDTKTAVWWPITHPTVINWNQRTKSTETKPQYCTCTACVAQ